MRFAGNLCWFILLDSNIDIRQVAVLGFLQLLKFLKLQRVSSFSQNTLTQTTFHGPSVFTQVIYFELFTILWMYPIRFLAALLIEFIYFMLFIHISIKNGFWRFLKMVLESSLVKTWKEHGDVKLTLNLPNGLNW